MGPIRQWFLSRWGNFSGAHYVSAPSCSRIYFSSLDGWRALSVMGVILYHGRFSFFRDDSYMRRISAHGEMGVDVFFAISGFLICSLLLQEFRHTSQISLRSFYLRRLFRIVPAYYLVIATLCVLGILKLIRVDFDDLPSCLLFYRNYRPLGMDSSGGFYTAHFWSLSVEEHFYLLWPTLLLVTKPKRIGPAAVALAAAAAGWREIEARYHVGAALLNQQNLMARTDTRIDSLLWACVAAVYFPILKRSFDRIPFNEIWLVFAGILAALVAFHVPGSDLLIPIILPLLVIRTVVKPSIFSQFLESLPLRWIGTLSYSIYLWQELFLPETPSVKANGALRNLQHGPWNLIAILACSCLSYYLFERPMNRLAHRLSAVIKRQTTGHLRSRPTPGFLAS